MARAWDGVRGPERAVYHVPKSGLQTGDRAPDIVTLYVLIGVRPRNSRKITRSLTAAVNIPGSHRQCCVDTYERQWSAG